ncbi:MAG TPA: ADP-ribosylglycohydrolase family protein [Thermomicrobiales bacterium]|nr:ADP-ribosylglycohydrolase family protein [Thermomicrobiales bacterium]
MSVTSTPSTSSSAALDARGYRERVYAGVLGKIIGVYLGRPFEGWTHEKILRDLGEVDRYVNDRINLSERRAGLPVVVTDDDIAGTFTFFRALEDNGYDPALTPAQIGEGWLNYLIENRTVLWWGGLGVSTEHTAYLRLKQGTPAPASGSIARNGTTIAEQIGSQIFIDAWPMLFPGDPERAVDFARRAASVSHDGEAIYGAQVVAALEAQAFVESDINALLDTAVGLIPADSTIARVIADIREWHAQEDDWYKTRALIGERYGYDKFPGACHMVPNHALIIHALLHGNDDLRRSLMIVNTSGWDTDCNSGNVGCILGIKNGLRAFDDVPDLREPVQDRMYLSTADGGRAVTDAVREAQRIIDARQAIGGEPVESPKGGARFHFEMPGAVQGFRARPGDPVAVENVAHDGAGERALAIRLTGHGAGTVTTPAFIPEEAKAMVGYTLFASPTLYPGQKVVAQVAADPGNIATVTATVVLMAYGADDTLGTREGTRVDLAPGEAAEIAWEVPDLDGAPVAEIGLRIGGAEGSTVYLDALDWRGAPTVTSRIRGWRRRCAGGRG